jgi:hypothetical protein
MQESMSNLYRTKISLGVKRDWEMRRASGLIAQRVANIGVKKGGKFTLAHRAAITAGLKLHWDNRRAK